MKKTFFKNLFRDIKKTLSRFLSIVIIIAMGVAFYAGVRATSPDMKKSADFYFNQTEFMDFKLISTLGLTKDDLAEVQKLKGVKKAEGSFSIDAVVEKDKHSLVINVNSIPPESGINKVKIITGRIAKANNEVVVEEGFLKENKLKIGDVIELKSGKDALIDNDLKNSRFKIVGTALSPLYLSAQRQLSSVGNGTVRGFIYILPDVFKSDVYTEIYVKDDSEESKDSLILSEDYKKTSNNMKQDLKDIGVIRSKVRYSQILKATQGKINIAENNDIKKPEWYVLGRDANLGYETYRQDSERIDNIGKAFPLIFFLVAALVSLTTMTRMVQENRIEIGTLKALGYSRMAITTHYLIYALLASITGSIVGVSFGFRLFPPLIMNAYSSLYSIPSSLTPFNPSLALQSSLIAILFTTLAAGAATLEELREAPASLMRPKPPKAGKTILLEKITFIWKKLSFTSKVTARNIFRYKQRFFMTVIGIAVCTGLMITGFGLKSGIMGAVESQFTNIYRYDMQSTLRKDIDDNQKDITQNKIMKDDNVKSVLFSYTKNGTVDLYKSGREDAYLVVTEDKKELNKYINLTMKGTDLSLKEDGVIITEKLSKLMNKKIGDIFEITINDKVVKARISGITEHYLQHYIYISSDYYKKITGENLKFNGFYGLLKSTSDSAEDNTTKVLTRTQNIGSINYKNKAHFDFNKTTKSINSVVLVLIVSAGVLAFVVIYNLTNININERKRELSTIKLLGFYDSELALYIYRENIILTVIGSLTGIAVGILLCGFVINTSETNVMMFMRKIDPIYFLYSVLLTISFSIIVNLVMYREFGNIDMIESLKSAE
ncbi:ABC transporter permease [Clostridium sp. CF011]|uniref:ABC transporter permease n=1 Tax=Clostridium sp. CF011 TaxID=2843318 RepID=UPI001C0BF768|nr:ABC transporter permease [Clostridium sp. CF011]MBU3092058.1 ABC transporter permease [Clostridium sp. CF011]WAG71340.1 ABC transporter permease [Clostridium sp. CF011]